MHHLDRVFWTRSHQSWRPTVGTRDHIRQSYRVLEGDRRASKPARIVSLVRDPIARISAFFQNKDLLAKSVEDVDAAIARFTDTYSHDVPLAYFDLHIKPVFGVDVFETPFDHDRKRLITSVGGYSVLILRAEDPDEHKQSALASSRAPATSRSSARNVGANKVLGPVFSFWTVSVCPIRTSTRCSHQDGAFLHRGGWRVCQTLA